MSADEVALARHRDDVGQVGDQAPGGVEVIDDSGLEEEPSQGRSERAGCLDDIERVRRAGGQPRPVAAVRSVGVAAAEHEPGAAEVGVLEVVDRAEGRADVGHGHGVRRRAQRCGHRRLVAGAHRQQRGDRPEQT